MTTLRNSLFYALGLAALAAASLRHRVGGYRKPTDFSPDDWPMAVSHVRDIVEDWCRYFTDADGRPKSVMGLDILELGPGATLGTGVLLMGLGARSYRAIDAFALADRTPKSFYRTLEDAVRADRFDAARVRDAVAALEDGQSDAIAYRIDPDFDIVRAAEGRSFDLILSNAAFEHFDDIEQVLAQVTEVARPGATLIAGIDFQTHTRGIRGRDPNSIYRFSPSLYQGLSYPGQPNRRRPGDYLAALRRLGWIDAECLAVDVADEAYCTWSRAGLSPAFQGDGSDMHVLTGILCAEKR